MVDETSASTKAGASLAVLGILLLSGHLLRVKIKALRIFFFPASLIGGFLGLLVFKLIDLNEPASAFIRGELLNGWEDLPAALTNVVFACLVLGTPLPSAATVYRLSGPQLCFAQCLAFGQYAICSLLAASWFEPSYNVSAVFGAIIPVGFEGGHGVVAGMRDSFDASDPHAYDQGMVAATLGLLLGTLLSWLTVNWAARTNNLTTRPPGPGAKGAPPLPTSTGPDGGGGRSTPGESDAEGPLVHSADEWWHFDGVFERDERPVAGHQTVSVESLDTLALHLAVTGCAIGIGWTIKKCLVLAEDQDDYLRDLEFFDSFPLFPFTMVGAVMIQATLDGCKVRSIQLDPGTMTRIAGTCMDYLILSALATLNFTAVSTAPVPFFVSCGAVFLWTVLAVCTLGRLLPDMWVERATVEAAMSLGATATALLTLRMVDPDNKTVLLRAFCYKQIFHVCIVGGGAFTSSSVTIARTQGSWVLFGIAGSMAAVALVLLVVCSAKVKSSNARKEQASSNPPDAQSTARTPLLDNAGNH